MKHFSAHSCETVIGVAPTPGYDPTSRVLMDSWNYINLLGTNRNDAVWQQVDNDINNPPGFTTNVSKLVAIMLGE